jgi:nuclear transport factor 2 (NTF2) superfamily protein
VRFLTRKWSRELDYRLIKNYGHLMPIAESERKFHWRLGRRPDGHEGLSALGL